MHVHGIGPADDASETHDESMLTDTDALVTMGGRLTIHNYGRSLIVFRIGFFKSLDAHIS